MLDRTLRFLKLLHQNCNFLPTYQPCKFVKIPHVKLPYYLLSFVSINEFYSVSLANLCWLLLKRLACYDYFVFVFSITFLVTGTVSRKSCSTMNRYGCSIYGITSAARRLIILALLDNSAVIYSKTTCYYGINLYLEKLRRPKRASDLLPFYLQPSPSSLWFVIQHRFHLKLNFN